MGKRKIKIWFLILILFLTKWKWGERGREEERGRILKVVCNGHQERSNCS